MAEIKEEILDDAVSTGECAEEKACEGEKKCKKKEKKDLSAEIARLEAELSEQQDKYLRMAAEYDNFRRRSREEKDGVYENALADTVAQLLPIIDNLDRAALYDDGEKVKEGLAMTLKSVQAVFSSMGIESVGAAGETFDPNLHNAVMHIDDETYGEGEITEVFQKGYKKGKHIIRFAMVKSAN